MTFALTSKMVSNLPDSDSGVSNFSWRVTEVFAARFAAFCSGSTGTGTDYLDRAATDALSARPRGLGSVTSSEVAAALTELQKEMPGNLSSIQKG